MLNYDKSKRSAKSSSKLLNNIFKQNNRNSYLLDTLIRDLYLDLLGMVPEKVARSASANSKNVFEYFLNYSTEDIKLILIENDCTWSLHYKVCPSYLDEKQKLNSLEKSLDLDAREINLKDFYEKNVKKYYN